MVWQDTRAQSHLLRALLIRPCSSAAICTVSVLLFGSFTAAQPLVGGGGGGGGGGGSSSSSSDSGPICSSHCKSCTTDYTCDVCQTGYVRTAARQCAACARNCDKCDQAGAGRCDQCSRGYVLVQDECLACADNCVRCDFAGRDRCDECEDGYMVGPTSLCDACTAHCRKCRDTTVTGCFECFWWYYLEPEGSCAFDYTKGCVAATLVTLSVLLLYRFSDRCCDSRRSRSGSLARLPPVVGHREYVEGSTQHPEMERVDMPSGTWRGYYTYSGQQHDVCAFNLEFGEGWIMSGDGVDDVGHYTMSGTYSRTRIAFSKKYQARSRNASGVVTYGNKGHSVEYRGELAGTSLGNGFRGQWSIRDNLGNYDGQFHIWPAMEGWSDSAPQGVGASSGQVFEESECVVCYDRAISTCLRPCGHVALCEICASRLHPRKCPLCRQNIASVERHAPAADNSSHRD
eukprot:TRINITY_DN15042_c1_g1_i1.p1 TRINITY_DN15042_c1_g1~~TRINITY_DN15042_c1_g1_i1.p1  ORF type:complete len:458 (+),score=14.80 TRINITY_DN15042_c1_g1_i1:80-1453(+)